MDFLQRLDRALQEARIIPQPGDISGGYWRVGKMHGRIVCPHCWEDGRVPQGEKEFWVYPPDKIYADLCAICHTATPKWEKNRVNDLPK